jgi:hypothetical protein
MRRRSGSLHYSRLQHHEFKAYTCGPFAGRESTDFRSSMKIAISVQVCFDNLS